MVVTKLLYNKIKIKIQWVVRYYVEILIMVLVNGAPIEVPLDQIKKVVKMY